MLAHGFTVETLARLVTDGYGGCPGGLDRPRLLRARDRLPPEVGDRQPSHLDRPPAGMHGPRRRRR
jgi:hypothetical protein